MIRFNIIKCSTNCNKKERGIVSLSNVLQLNSGRWRKIVIYIIDCRKNQWTNSLQLWVSPFHDQISLSSDMWHLKNVSSETPNVCFEMHTTILKYLEEMPLVFIWKTGKSFLSKDLNSSVNVAIPTSSF